MAEKVKVLFVDDEPAIRSSLPAVLNLHGFEVTSAASVGEALQVLSAKRFDVLISDLNIGSPGDGFTVVSAMRRTQSDCVTLILTGYPAFETALQAIRSQVDDYLIKPAGVQQLVRAIEDKLRNRTPHKLERLKALPQILNENVGTIVDQMLKSARRIMQSPRVRLSEQECRDNTESLLRGLAAQLATGTSQLSAEMTELSRRRGVRSHEQGYSPSMLVEENRYLSAAVLDCIHGNLLVVDVSRLVPDLKLLTDTLANMLCESISAHSSVARAA
jgi:ActR/RegA family two-component response regulator